MNIPVSIMHISDLHRSKDSYISNSSLLSSLLNDVDRYDSETPPINKPNIIVISGDVIRGSSSKDNSNVEIQEQYSEASSFLNDLVNNILEGDKERIIIVPGNHDIDWNTSIQSMKSIDDDQIRDSEGKLKSSILEEAISTNSSIKWSWDDMKFYKVEDEALYKNRLKHFADFYNVFYEGKRAYSLDPSEQFEIFDMPNLGISILGFNSCHNNDHLNRAGAIHPDCIANSNIKLKKIKMKDRLLLAAWHHNTNGMPYSNDYIDSRFLKNLIDSDVKLGFHGHQHETAIIHEANNIFEQNKITVFSSGTLCGSPREIPTGYNRQYNVIDISTNSNNKSELDIVLHSREKTAASSFDNPVWGKGNIDSSASSYFKLTVSHELTALNTDYELAKAESLVSDKKYEIAIRELKELDNEDPIVRKLLLICYFELGESDSILNEFNNPINEEEAIHSLNASISSGDKSKMHELLSSSFIVASNDPSVVHIKEKIKALLK